jgi:Protein of unknown function (DUF3515)
VAEADAETGAPPRLLIIVAAVLAVGLAVGVAVFGLKAGTVDSTAGSGPLPLVPVPAPYAGTAPCHTLLDALPSSLTSNGAQLKVRDLANPAPTATMAWGEDNPIVLRCGLDKPPELTTSSQLRLVNDVQWLQVTGDGAATWYIVDRDVYSALTVPDNAGTGPLQEISDIVATKLPARPLRF